MKTGDLKRFLIESNNAGYAAGNSKKWIKEKDGSTTIPFEKGKWRSNDNFFGGEPYGGRNVVFLENKPVWIMVYYGFVIEEKNVDKVYKVLREALRKMPTNYPFRGPKTLKFGEYKYSNSWRGDIENYSGEEKIMKNKKLVYKANYLGGLVDKRKGV